MKDFGYRLLKGALTAVAFLPLGRRDLDGIRIGLL